MARQLTLTVPETVTSHFVIATAAPPRDPVAAVRSALERGPADPPARLADDLLDTPLLEVRTEVCADRAAWPGFGAPMASTAFAAAGTEPAPAVAPGAADPEAGLRLAHATHNVVVTAHAPPLAQPEHAQAARVVARILAEACGGLIYDTRCGRVLPADFPRRPEPLRFRLADRWLAGDVTPVPRGEPGGRVPRSYLVETAGLHRFGLPELATVASTRAGARRPLNLLRGVAARLLAQHWDWLRRHPGEPRRPLGRHLWVEAHHVWSYWGDAPPPDADARVRVRLARSPDECPGAPPFLEVGPPIDFSGTRRDWFDDVVATVVPEAVGTADDVAA